MKVYRIHVKTATLEAESPNLAEFWLYFLPLIKAEYRNALKLSFFFSLMPFHKH